MLVLYPCFRYFTSGGCYTQKNGRKRRETEKNGKNALVATSMAPTMVLAMTRQSCDPPERRKKSSESKF